MPVSYRLTLKLDRNAVDKAGADIAYREIVNVTRRVFNRATVLTPVRFGNLRAHNQMRTNRAALTGEVWNDTTYARAVHWGSKPTVIVPKRKKVLRFTVGGEVVFARRVTIPGRRGRPWLLRALKEVAAQSGYRVDATSSGVP